MPRSLATITPDAPATTDAFTPVATATPAAPATSTAAVTAAAIALRVVFIACSLPCAATHRSARRWGGRVTDV